MILKKKNKENPFAFSLIILIVITLTLSLVSSFFGIQNVQGGEEEVEYEFELVSGYFNTISYEGSSQEITIRLDHEDEYHSYEWSYSDDEWSGDTELLIQEDTSFDDGEWEVRVAVDHDVPLGDNWTLTIDGEEKSVNVVGARTPRDLMGSLNFLVEPFSENGEDIDSITIPNNGNVPLSFEIEYDDSDFEGQLTHEKEEEIIEPGGRAKLNFTHIRTTEGPVRDVISNMDYQNITLTISYLGELDREAEGNVVIGTQYNINVPGTVYVGYEDYEHESGDNYDLQFKENVRVDGDIEDNITYYVYPRDELDVDLRETNISIEDSSFDFEDTLSPEENEIPIEITFRSHHVDDGEITLIIDDDEYTTSIDIGRPAPEPETERDFLSEQGSTITGSVIFAIIIGFMAVRYWKK